jgi:hypothetical protein
MATKKTVDMSVGARIRTTRRNGENVTARVVRRREASKGEWLDVVPVNRKGEDAGPMFSIRPSMAR